jgi:hypothetical protein
MRGSPRGLHQRGWRELQHAADVGQLEHQLGDLEHQLGNLEHQLGDLEHQLGNLEQRIVLLSYCDLRGWPTHVRADLCERGQVLGKQLRWRARRRGTGGVQ